MARNTVDKTDPIPRYLQVRRILERSIRAGNYRSGDRLPGERDLARDLQVSQMTVNRAILAMVSDGWLRRETGNGTFVREDFTPPVAVAPRIGFALPFGEAQAEGDFYLSALLAGVHRACALKPAHLVALELQEEALPELLATAPIDGCILPDLPRKQVAGVAALVDAGTPIVLLGGHGGPLHVPSVDSDNYGGARAAMAHLIDLGHRRIAGVFAYTGSSNSRDRRRGYRDALKQACIALPPEFEVAPTDRSLQLDGVARGVRALLAAPVRPTAFFCGGYYIALETLQTVRDAGLRVPTDLSVVGFDDPVSARYFTPPLTTVRQPLVEMGLAAVDVLCGWLATGREPPGSQPMPVDLVLRGSTAPANRGA